MVSIIDRDSHTIHEEDIRHSMGIGGESEQQTSSNKPGDWKIRGPRSSLDMRPANELQRTDVEYKGSLVMYGNSLPLSRGPLISWTLLRKTRLQAG